MNDAALALEVVVDLLGIAGAIVATLPVLSDFSRKRLQDTLGRAAGLGPFDALLPRAKEVVADDLIRFRFSDGHCFRWGLGLIAGSYALHIVTLALHRLAD